MRTHRFSRLTDCLTDAHVTTSHLGSSHGHCFRKTSNLISRSPMIDCARLYVVCCCQSQAVRELTRLFCLSY